MLWPARHNRDRTKKPAAQRRDGGAARGAFRGWTLYGARHSLRCQALDDPVLIITGLAFPAVPEAVGWIGGYRTLTGNNCPRMWLTRQSGLETSCGGWLQNRE